MTARDARIVLRVIEQLQHLDQVAAFGEPPRSVDDAVRR